MKSPIDNFSKQSKLYSRFRPTYPQSLYDFIISHVDSNNNCWDCATGNGQVARVLASKFDQVYATDISENQLQLAFKAPNIKYSISRAEETHFPDGHFNLITVGQALHWFDFQAFAKEVKRVAHHQAILAAWGYGLFKVNKEVDQIIENYYNHIVGPYWNFERKYIETKYRTIPLPIKEIAVNGTFRMEKKWNLDHLMGYFESWSSTQNFISHTHQNPLPQLRSELLKVIGPNENLLVTFPLFLRLGVVSV